MTDNPFPTENTVQTEVKQTEAVQTQTSEQQIIEQKTAQWGAMGVACWRTELVLQTKAAEIINGLLELPTKVEDIPAAEIKLKQSKSALSALIEERKVITSKLDSVTNRLMAAEKSIPDPLQKFEQAIIGCKKLKEIADTKLRQKQIELQLIEKFFGDKVAEYKTNSMAVINKQLDAAFNYCLNNDITVEALPALMTQFKAKFKPTEHFIFSVASPQLQNVSIDEYRAVCTPLIPKEQFDYYNSEYLMLLDAKFSDYHISIQDKVLAKQRAAEESAKAAEAAKKKEDEEKAFNTLNASASVSTNSAPTIETKSLKKVYVLDMEETIDNAIKLWAAFAGNKTLVEEKMRVNKWFSCSPSQIAGALCKIKNEDNNFQPQGIVFKQDDKL
jgi:hypothetical protein